MEKENLPPRRCKVILSQVLACLALNVLLIDLGTSISFVTVVLPEVLDAKEGLSLTHHQASWFGSMAFLCQPLGSIFSGPLIDTFGRKKALFLVNIPHVIAWLLMHFAWNVPSLFIANALLGIGTGIMEAPSVTYVGEISEPSIRGPLTTITNLFTSTGIFSAYLLGSVVPWRRAALLCLSAPLATMLLVLLVPETPIWLLSKGKKAEALKSLCQVRGWAHPDHVKKEFEQLVEYNDIVHQCVACIKTKQNLKPSCEHENMSFIKKTILKIRYILLTKETLRPFKLVIAYFLFHSMSGLAAIKPNMVNLCKAFGMNYDAKGIVIIVGILSIAMSFVSASLVKIVGKRILVITSMLCCTICTIALSIYAKVNIPEDVFSYNTGTFPEEKSVIPLVLFLLMAAFTGLGIPWVLLSEVFPFRSRGSATGLAAALSYLIFFIATKTNLDLESYFHLSGAFAFYAAFGFVGTVYLYLFLPETENKTLVEIEGFYKGGRRIFADDPCINCFRRKNVNVKEENGLMQGV